MLAHNIYSPGSWVQLILAGPAQHAVSDERLQVGYRARSHKALSRIRLRSVSRTLRLPLLLAICTVFLFYPFFSLWLLPRAFCYQSSSRSGTQALGTPLNNSSTLDKSLGDQRTLRIAIYDSFGPNHEEVIAPFAYALSRIPNANLILFRTDTTHGFKEGLQAFFPGPLLDQANFFEQHEENSYDTWINNTDVLVLTTSNQDIEQMLRRELVKRYPGFTNTKVIAVSHFAEDYLFTDKRVGTSEWGRTEVAQAREAKAWADNKLAFLTLSEKVRDRVRIALGDNPFLLKDHRPEVEAFIPAKSHPLIIDHITKSVLQVIPNLGGIAGSPRSPSFCDNVVIQGRLSWNRDYGRIFGDLEVELQANASAWGYKLVNPQGEAGSPVFVEEPRPDTASGKPFKLHLVGRSGMGGPTIPDSLREVVTIHRNLDFANYYATLSQMDLLLPAWHPDSEYLGARASSSIPAAASCRMSPTEKAAFLYMRYTAVAHRAEEETEVQAIKRMREEGTCHRGAPEEWEQLEQDLMQQNQRSLRRTMNLHAKYR